MSVRVMARMDRTIKITDKVHNMLKSMVENKDETFSDIIERIADFYKKEHPKK